MLPCNREKYESEQRRNDTAGAQSRLKWYTRRRGDLWGEEGGKEGGFWGRVHIAGRNYHKRAEHQEKKVWVEFGRTGEQQRVARLCI